MKLRRTFALLLLLATSVCVADEIVAMGGGSLDTRLSGICITEAQRAAVTAKIEAYYREHGPVDMGERGGAPAPYPFFPQAGTFWGDIFANNFVDLDNTAGILDYDCTDYTYDGHHGSDTDIVTWKQKNIGVPIYAALAGTVIAIDDGHFDEQTTLNPLNLPNYVILDHGGGHQTWYFHLKTGSVAVAVNDLVEPGQQLGLTASSGYSTGPHLHFESRFGGTHYEPFSGTCGPSTSGFVNQEPFDRSMYLREFIVTTQNLGTWTGPPVDTTRTGWFVTGLQPFYIWTVIQNLPASSTWQLRFVRPNSSVALDSGVQNFSNPFYRWSYFYWNPTVNFDVLGTWTVELLVNGSIAASGPLEIAALPGDFTNRTPNSGLLGGVDFAPLAPTNIDAIRCTIDTPLILRDPDYDQVRYNFVWEVNSVEVRNVTIAAVSDMLPPQNLGDVVECTVTVLDGVGGSSVPQTDSVTIGGTSAVGSWDGYR